VSSQKPTSLSASSNAATSELGQRLSRLHRQQQRADRLNYIAVAIGSLIALYVVVTIIRPLFASTRPGKITQDFGCISKSTVSDCSAGNRQ
jgi:hypothetical protein